MMSIPQDWQLVNIFIVFLRNFIPYNGNYQSVRFSLPLAQPSRRLDYDVRKEMKHEQKNRCHGR